MVQPPSVNGVTPCSRCEAVLGKCEDEQGKGCLLLVLLRLTVAGSGWIWLMVVGSSCYIIYPELL